MRYLPTVGDRVADLLEAKEYVVAEVRAPRGFDDESRLYVVRLRLVRQSRYASRPMASSPSSDVSH